MVKDSQLLWLGTVVDTDVVSEMEQIYAITGDGKMIVNSQGEVMAVVGGAGNRSPKLR